MSFLLRYSFMAELRDGPPALLEWLGACIAKAPVAPAFEVAPVAVGMEDEVAWLLGLAGRLDGDPGAAQLLSVQVHHLHESAAAAVYGLPFIVAPYCAPGTIAVAWTDMNPDVEPTLFFVQDGVAWVGNRNGLPVPAVDDDPGRLVWRLGIDRPDPEALARLGVADVGTMVEQEAAGEPAVARHLLVRSVERNLAGLDVSHLTPAEAARAGARLALDLVDAGGDPLLVKDTPGWQLEEVAARHRYGGGPVRSSGRALTRLSDALDELPPGSLDAGPRCLVEGDVVTTLGPVVLRATGPTIHTTDERGNRVGSRHQLRVEVPAGARLVLTKVYEKGHAECRPEDGDFFPWVRPEDRPWSDQPQEPVAGADEYSLGWLSPDDQGRLFERRFGSRPRPS